MLVSPSSKIYDWRKWGRNSRLRQVYCLEEIYEKEFEKMKISYWFARGIRCQKISHQVDCVLTSNMVNKFWLRKIVQTFGLWRKVCPVGLSEVAVSSSRTFSVMIRSYGGARETLEKKNLMLLRNFKGTTSPPKKKFSLNKYFSLHKKYPSFELPTKHFCC